MAKRPSPFAPALLQQMAAGNQTAIFRFLDQIRPQCCRLVAWHQRDRGLPDDADHVDDLIAAAVTSFVQSLKQSGVPDQPKLLWFRTLIRRINPLL